MLKHRTKPQQDNITIHGKKLLEHGEHCSKEIQSFDIATSPHIVVFLWEGGWL